MDEIINAAGVSGLAVMLLVVVILFVWFYVSRASARNAQQMALLQALLEEKKKQTELLCAIRAAMPGAQHQPQDEAPVDKSMIHLIPER